MKVSYPIYKLLKRERVQYFKIQNGILSSNQIKKQSKNKPKNSHFFLNDDLGLADGIYYIQDFYLALKVFFEIQENPYKNDFIADFIDRQNTPHDDMVVTKYDKKTKKHDVVPKDAAVKYIHAPMNDNANLYLHFKELTDWDYCIFDDTTKAFKFDDCSDINLTTLINWTKLHPKLPDRPVNEEAIKDIREEATSEIQELLDNDKTLTMRNKNRVEIEQKLNALRQIRYKKTNYGVDASYDSIPPTEEEIEFENEIVRIRKHDKKISKINRINNKKIRPFLDGKSSLELISDGTSVILQGYDHGNDSAHLTIELGSSDKEFRIPVSSKLLPHDKSLKFDVDTEKRIVHYFNPKIHYVKYY
jgi:hypothetical protein